MTLSELRKEIWQQAGEPSDLDPTTDVQYNGGPLLTWAVNEAQRQIAFWNDPETHAFKRFRCLESDFFTQWQVITGTLTSNGTANTITFPIADVNDEDDRYNGWVVVLGSEGRHVVDYDGSALTATVHDDFTSTPAIGDTYTLCKRYGMLLDSSHPWQADHITLPSATTRFQSTGNLFEVLKIEDLLTAKTLRKAPEGEEYLAKALSPGDPTFWWRYGNRLYLDVPIDTERWFRVMYYRSPTAMVNSTDEPELPEPFHWPMVLWGIAWAMRRQGETSDKWATNMDLVTLMRTLRTQYEIEFEQDSDAGSLQLR